MINLSNFHYTKSETKKEILRQIGEIDMLTTQQFAQLEQMGLMRNDYTLDEERWISFEEEDSTIFPPIIVHPTIKEGDYHIVDGCHRLAHQNSKGHVEVLAFIGHIRCVG